MPRVFPGTKPTPKPHKRKPSARKTATPAASTPTAAKRRRSSPAVRKPAAPAASTPTAPSSSAKRRRASPAAVTPKAPPPPPKVERDTPYVTPDSPPESPPVPPVPPRRRRLMAPSPQIPPRRLSLDGEGAGAGTSPTHHPPPRLSRDATRRATPRLSLDGEGAGAGATRRTLRHCDSTELWARHLRPAGCSKRTSRGPIPTRPKYKLADGEDSDEWALPGSWPPPMVLHPLYDGKVKRPGIRCEVVTAAKRVKLPFEDLSEGILWGLHATLVARDPRASRVALPAAWARLALAENTVFQDVREGHQVPLSWIRDEEPPSLCFPVDELSSKLRDQNFALMVDDRRVLPSLLCVWSGSHAWRFQLTYRAASTKDAAMVFTLEGDCGVRGLASAISSAVVAKLSPVTAPAMPTKRSPARARAPKAVPDAVREARTRQAAARRRAANEKAMSRKPKSAQPEGSGWLSATR